jgi:hypothetical protein
MIQFDEQKQTRIRAALAELEEAVKALDFSGDICFHANRVEITRVDDSRRRYLYELSLLFTDDTWIGRSPTYYKG